MKHVTMIGLMLMAILGSQVLQAEPNRTDEFGRRGFRPITPIQIRLNQRDRQLVREIEKNRFKIVGLRRDNRRLVQKMRYVSPRRARHYIRAIERNERRIDRLERENRYLMKRIRRH